MDDTFVNKSLLDKPGMRGLIRLLHIFQSRGLKRNQGVDDNEAREFETLKTNRKDLEKDVDFVREMGQCTEVLAQFMDMRQDAIKELNCAVSILSICS